MNLEVVAVVREVAMTLDFAYGDDWDVDRGDLGVVVVMVVDLLENTSWRCSV